MTSPPTHDDPLFILAMDHRDSFGKSLFDVGADGADDDPTDEQRAAMQSAKALIYQGLLAARASIGSGRAGVLVDETYGQSVIDRARADGVVLAMPIEASGHEWFELLWGERWLDHLQAARPDYAKVLVRDNPDFAAADRKRQLDELARVSARLHEARIPLIYELLVPATDAQKSAAGGADAYDRDVRPELTVRLLADNHAAGVAPALWKIEGLETVEAARLVARQAEEARLIVLGRDAPTERVEHWLAVAGEVAKFVGFAIGRSIWEDAIRDWREGSCDDDAVVAAVARAYSGFARRWRPAR